VATNQDDQQWAEKLIRNVGLAIKKARRGGKSAKRLSEETAALGYRVSPTVIAKLDAGHRGSVLSVAELLVLAAALNIPPALLLFPGYPDGEVEFLPGRNADAYRAVNWFSGEGRLPFEGPMDAATDIATFNEGIEIVRAMRDFVDASRTHMYLQTRLGLVGAMGAPLGSGEEDRLEAERSAEVERSLLEQQIREMNERLADLQDRVKKLAPAFKIEEKKPK
jgi:hypothetical protein